LSRTMLVSAACRDGRMQVPFLGQSPAVEVWWNARKTAGDEIATDDRRHH